MTAQKRLEIALRSSDPGPALRAVVQDLAREGLTKPQIYELLEKFVLQLRIRADHRDVEEEMVPEIANLDMVLKTMTPQIGRLVLVEVEYARAMRHAELAWVRSLREDIRAGRLKWSPRVMCQQAAGTQPQEQTDSETT